MLVGATLPVRSWNSQVDSFELDTVSSELNFATPLTDRSLDRRTRKSRQVRRSQFKAQLRFITTPKHNRNKCQSNDDDDDDDNSVWFEFLAANPT